MNDLVFEKTRKVLLSKQKELKKKGKGNRPNADGSEKDPIVVYKLYAQKRPEKMNEYMGK